MKIEYYKDVDCTSTTIEEFQGKFLDGYEYIYLKDTVKETKLDNEKLKRLGHTIRMQLTTSPTLTVGDIIRDLEKEIRVLTDQGYQPLTNIVVWDEEVNEEI